MNKDNFFNEMRKHSKIKLNIFEETLKVSISIANEMAKKFNTYNYVYIDLFAGTGLYQSGEKGSPLRAINIILNHKKTKNNKLKNFFVLFVEENKKHFLFLETEIKKNKEIYEKYNIFIEIKQGKWEEHKNCIKEYLKKSTFGFLFLDPFISINFKEFNNIIKDRSIRFKEIMMLFNLHSIIRNIDNEKALSSLEKILKIKFDKIIESDKPDEEIAHHIQKFFDKDFKTGISIPIDVKGKLKKIDYFILFLFTNSIGVADSFLKAYGSRISELYPHKKGGFDQGFNLKNDINEFLKSKHSATLYDLIVYFHKKVVSWKKAINVSVEVPTLKNLREILNKMDSDGKILITSSAPQLLGKRKKLLSKIRRKEDMEKIKIEKIPKR